MKYDIIIAIDPDVEKSGVAELSTRNKLLDTTNLSFPELLEYLQARKKMSDTAHTSLVIVVEAGWLNRSNWHLKNSDTSRIASAKGNSAGRNHETGRKIVEMARHYGLEVVEHVPLRKCWKGKDGKISMEELCNLLLNRKMKTLDKRVSQNCRDAILLALYISEIL